MNFRDLSCNVMARDKALYDGHAVAAVAATSRAAAEEALDRIRVDYEVLAHVVDVLEAMEPDAPLLHENLFTDGVEPKPERPSNVASRCEFTLGDLDAGFAAADVVVEGEYVTEAVHQGYIEPHAAVASVGEDGQCTIWCSSQGQFMVRAYCAKLLGMENSQIRVTPSEIGGGFGGKTTIYVEPVALALSRKAGRPVKMVMDRDEVFRATGPTSSAHVKVRIRGDEGRPDYRRGRGAVLPGGGLFRLPCAAWVHVRLRPLRHRQRAHGRLRRRRQSAQVRGLPGSGGADGRVRSRERARRARREARHGPARASPRQRGPRGHQGGLRAEVPRDRLRGNGRGRARPRSLPGRARTQPGPRGRLRLLVQHRRADERRRAHQRGRHRGGRGPEPRHRRLARVDGDHGRGGCSASTTTACVPSSPTPARSPTAT